MNGGDVCRVSGARMGEGGSDGTGCSENWTFLPPGCVPSSCNSLFRCSLIFSLHVFWSCERGSRCESGRMRGRGGEDVPRAKVLIERVTRISSEGTQARKSCEANT